MRFARSQLALRWCIGNGIEIGKAAHNDIVPHALNVAIPDAADRAFYNEAQRQMGETPARVDYDAEADALPFPVHSLDFVASSHVVEHLPNPIGALLEWHRVLKPGGIAFIICPKRDALAEDRGLPLTSLDHLVDDYVNARTLETHPTEGVPGGRRGHYHRFTLPVFLEMVEAASALRNGSGRRLFDVVETAETCHVGNGFVVVLGSLH